MSDFANTGQVATFHCLGQGSDHNLLPRLRQLLITRPLTLLLPCHVRDLQGVAFQNIISQLSSADLLTHLILLLDGAAEEDLSFAKEMLSASRHPTTVLWLDGPQGVAFRERLAAEGVDAVLTPGKGRTLWMGFGYAMKHVREGIVAIHDCDIETYQPELLARLVFPLAFAQRPFQFAKGYCARFSHRLHGRLMRLFLAPLLRALARSLPDARIVGVLSEFRYPLAGEVALSHALLGKLRLPSSWGVEIGLLDAVSRLLPLGSLCQSELGERYDHKHQDLSPDDPSRGLHRMAYEVGLEILRILNRDEICPPADLELFFHEESDLLFHRYELEASLNGLEFDATSERLASRVFAQALRESLNSGLSELSSLLPAWKELLRDEPELEAHLDKLVWSA